MKAIAIEGRRGSPHLWPGGSLEAFDAARDSQASGKVVVSLWLEQTEEGAR